jgi:hypothetical protein
MAVTVTVTVVVAVTVTVRVPPPMTAALRSITLCHSTPLNGPSPPKSYMTVQHNTAQHSTAGMVIVMVRKELNGMMIVAV